MATDSGLAGYLAARRRLPPPELRRAIRRGADVTLAQVGTELGVTATAVWLWETGRRTPRGDRLIAYVALLSDLAR